MQPQYITKIAEPWSNTKCRHLHSRFCHWAGLPWLYCTDHITSFL